MGRGAWAACVCVCVCVCVKEGVAERGCMGKVAASVRGR